MEPGTVVFQGKVGELAVVVRYPVLADADLLQTFINSASQEHTYIRLQGETFTFDEEVQYVDSALSQMKANKLVKLLVFSQEELLAVGDVTRQPLANDHLGCFGIIVKKEVRGTGLGRKLTEVLIEETKKQLPGIEKIVLSVYEQNAVARKLYESIGFIEYGRLPEGLKRNGAFDNEIEMYLSLHAHE